MQAASQPRADLLGLPGLRLLEELLDSLELRGVCRPQPFERRHFAARRKRTELYEFLQSDLVVQFEPRRHCVERNVDLETTFQQIVHGLIHAGVRF